MRWMGHVERIEETRNAYEFFVEKSEEKRSLEDLSVDRRIILIWILKKLVVWVWKFRVP
jgi:hypothetical protein